MIARYGVEDSPAGFPPLAQARRRSFSDARREALPRLSRNGDEERLQGVVVGNASLQAKDWTPWRGRFPQPSPIFRIPRNWLVASNPYAQVDVVPGELPTRNAPGGSLQDVSPKQQGF
jgi:hypothetical protein